MKKRSAKFAVVVRYVPKFCHGVRADMYIWNINMKYIYTQM